MLPLTGIHQGLIPPAVCVTLKPADNAMVTTHDQHAKYVCESWGCCQKTTAYYKALQRTDRQPFGSATTCT